MQRRVKPSVAHLLSDARLSFAAHGGEETLRQGLIMLACYGAYALSRAFVQGHEALALANGTFFMNLEKSLGIFWEPWIQAQVSRVGPLMTFLVWAYSSLHLPIIVGTMVWVFTQRRRSWVFLRNWFLVMNFMAVAVFLLLPTAPPRMLLTSGVADMDFLHGVRSQIFENGPLANPYAAMPSLHFAYALFVALALFLLARRRWLRWGGFAYPLLIFVAIVATGNHFILDAVGGGLVVAAAYACAVNLRPSEVSASTAVTVRERDG